MMIKRINTVVAPCAVDTTRRTPEVTGAAVLETHRLAVHQHVSHWRTPFGRREAGCASTREDARVHEGSPEQCSEGPQDTGTPARCHRPKRRDTHRHWREHQHPGKRTVNCENGPNCQGQKRQVGGQHAVARTENFDCRLGGSTPTRRRCCSCCCLDVHNRDHNSATGCARRCLCLSFCCVLRHPQRSRNAHDHLLPRQNCGRQKQPRQGNHETRWCSAVLLFSSVLRIWACKC